MNRDKTYLERVVEETIRPTISALDALTEEFNQTMNVPDAPWKILNKPYDQLSDAEVMALFDIYHQEGEPQPCSMCTWAARVELMKSRKEKLEGL